MPTHSELTFGDDRAAAVAAIDWIADGKGWCNVSPVVEEDVEPLRVSIFGLSTREGVPVASFVTNRSRKGEILPSSLGVLHARGRLGRERVRALLGDAPFATRQDHSSRGLVVSVPVDTSSGLVLETMCHLTEELSTYAPRGSWTMKVTLRD